MGVQHTSEFRRELLTPGCTVSTVHLFDVMGRRRWLFFNKLHTLLVASYSGLQPTTFNHITVGCHVQVQLQSVRYCHL
jgi:hypothetical protein